MLDRVTGMRVFVRTAAPAACPLPRVNSICPRPWPPSMSMHWKRDWG